MKRRTRIQRMVWLHSILAITLNGTLVWPHNMGLAPAPVRRHWIAREGGMIYDYRWYWRARLPGRNGQRCRIVARGSMNSVLVEFEQDGYRVVTSRYAVRRVQKAP